jgi:lysophospholipase L1-like esterase
VLQRKFGDAGHGFVLLAKPWQWYNHLGIEQGGTVDKWNIRPFTSAPLKDGIYGLGGVAFVPQRGKNAKAWVQTASEGDQGRLVETFDVSYLEQPGGGSFDVYVGNAKRRTVQTDGAEKKIRHVQIKVKLGSSRLRVVSNNDGPLRLFGVILETGEPGVVYDSLAINGARATALARFDSVHWTRELQYRYPSLIILMMGANEGANKFLNLKQYRADFSAILKTVKSAREDASCLVVGPLDQAIKKPTGGLGSKKMPAKLNRVQREVAFESGCAFFNTYEAMGGEGSMAKWMTTGLGGGDFIHPTKNGAQTLGNWLAEALLHAYQSYGK